MNFDLEAQEDELLALQSIFGSEEFIRNESKSAGEIRVSVELPKDFSVVLKHGKLLRQYDISFLPPLFLTFELPEDYPSSSPPSFSLSCSWLTHIQLALLSAQLTVLYQATGGAVVLFSWIQFLREDVLKLLDIYNLLELPSFLPDKQNKHDIEPSIAEVNKNTPKPTEVSDLCGSDPSVATGGNLLNSSTSAKSTDSQGASALDSNEANQNDLSSLLGEISLNTSNQTENPKTISSGTTVKPLNKSGSDGTYFQISEINTDNQNDLASAGDKSELPYSESVKSIQEAVLNKTDASASSNLHYLSEKEQIQPTEITPNKEPTSSGLNLTPSQKILSQILIYNAAQKQKVFATTVFNCGVCCMDWLGSECERLHECGHVFCRTCLSEFCKVQIKEGNVQGVTCPQDGCTATPIPAEVKSLVGDELFNRYDRLLLQSTLDCMPDVTYCPRQACASAVIVEKSSNAAMCSVCSFAFCVQCKKTYHGKKDCYEWTEQKRVEDLPATLPQSQEGKRALMDDYLAGSKQRQRLLESKYSHQMLLSIETNLNDDWKAVNTRTCPHCFCPIQKDGGCCMMRCSQCQEVFMWR